MNIAEKGITLDCKIKCAYNWKADVEAGQLH